MPNRVTREIREMAQALTVGNQAVIERLKRECEDGTIEPRLFIELLHYGYGKPRDKMAVQGPGLIQLILRRPLSEDPLAETTPIETAESSPPLATGLTPLPPGL